MTGSARQAAGAGTAQPSALSYRGRTSGYGLVPGTRSSARWFFSAIWLVYLVAPVSNLFPHRVHRHLVQHSTLWIGGGLAITVAFCATYIYLVGARPQARWRAGSSLAVLILLTVLAPVIYGQDWLSLSIYTSAAIGFAVSTRRAAMLAVGGFVACFSLLAWVTDASWSNFLGILLPVVVVGIAMTGLRLQTVLLRELSQARETVAKLAASEERLRVTRDMHDLTGQSLSVITLKSDLAAKILDRLPDSAERAAAMSELADIGRVSRQTLHDIREALSGYRRPTLAIEIITARAACEAARIDLDDGSELTTRSGSIDPEAEAVLAWCLREAVTNVVRHSGASHCRVRLREGGGELSLEVADDGRGLAAGQHETGQHETGQHETGQHETGQRPAGGALPHGGTGLHGMSERLSAVGGRLSLSSAGLPRNQHRGLRLIATVPVPLRERTGKRPGERTSPRTPALGGAAAVTEG